MALNGCTLAAQLSRASAVPLLSSAGFLWWPWLEEGCSRSLQLPPQADSLSGRLRARVRAGTGVQPRIRRILLLTHL